MTADQALLLQKARGRIQMAMELAKQVHGLGRQRTGEDGWTLKDHG